MVFLKKIFEKVNFEEKKTADNNIKHTLNHLLQITSLKILGKMEHLLQMLHFLYFHFSIQNITYIFLDFFSMSKIIKNRKLCHNLKIDDGVKRIDILLSYPFHCWCPEEYCFRP